MELARQYFTALQLFSKAEIEEYLSLGTLVTLKKGETFIREGQYCKKVGFILSGIFRSYYISSKGEEVTYCFRFPNQFVGAYSSFITGQPSVENLEAITDAELLVFTKEDIDTFVNNDIRWLRLTKSMAEYEYIELEHRVFQLQKEEAIVRYTYLLEKQPTLIQQIPLKYLASYLGITQRHLSRLRKAVS